ncbi:hypothetical protein PIB30_040105 [Stylosanthes scabra]|uniref:Uncharacterized protein n=1 Tax=Stylosanthes scabra TaxID=79078 RepID=A0ABU6QDZ1_9FABA|nr:hypothetical protein [Stylosanthes scabra]
MVVPSSLSTAAVEKSGGRSVWVRRRERNRKRERPSSCFPGAFTAAAVGFFVAEEPKLVKEYLAQPLLNRHRHCWLRRRASGCWGTVSLSRKSISVPLPNLHKAWLLPSYCRRCMLRRRASTRWSGLPHSILNLRVVARTSYLILTIIHETVVRKGKHDDGGCWFAWWCHNCESPEPPLRHREFTVVSSHRRCSLSSPEFIRLPKTKPYPSLDLSSGPFPLPRL